MKRRVLTVSAVATISYLLLAGTALAHEASDGGQGLVGETSDKGVTFAAFGVMFFFIFIVTVFSVIQSRLVKRKEEQKATSLHRRIGW